MARMPDGWVIIAESDDRGVEVRLKEARELVMCKNCKHRPTDNRGADDMTGFAIEFPDECCPCQCEDGWYNRYPHDSWFCANGERRDDDAAD